MRKLQRLVLRRYAEKANGKTIKVFRSTWKKLRTPKGYTTLDSGKQVKQKSLLRRKIGQALKAGRKP